MALSENLRLFFNANQFADVAELVKGGSLTGIFDDQAAVASGGLGMETSNITFTIPASDFHQDLIGAELIINNTHYLIEQRGQSERATAVLILSLA